MRCEEKKTKVGEKMKEIRRKDVRVFRLLFRLPSLSLDLTHVVCFYDFHGKVKFRWMWPAA